MESADVDSADVDSFQADTSESEAVVQDDAKPSSGDQEEEVSNTSSLSCCTRSLCCSFPHGAMPSRLPVRLKRHPSYGKTLHLRHLEILPWDSSVRGGSSPCLDCISQGSRWSRRVMRVVGGSNGSSRRGNCLNRVGPIGSGNEVTVNTSDHVRETMVTSWPLPRHKMSELHAITCQLCMQSHSHTGCVLFCRLSCVRCRN